MTDLDFPHGANLSVMRSSGPVYDKLGNMSDATEVHEIGPCSIVDQHGTIDYAEDGTARWIGTVDVQAPPESDVKAADKIGLPNGDVAIVVKPPERPRNPFTGWTPFVQFTIAAPGYTPAYGSD